MGFEEIGAIKIWEGSGHPLTNGRLVFFENMWSVNMQHFLDEKGSTGHVPARAKELANH